MKFKNTKVMNFDGAFRGLRNPLESWQKSDSTYLVGNQYTKSFDNTCYAWVDQELSRTQLPPGQKPITQDDNRYWNLFDKYLDWLIEVGTLSYNPETECEEIFAIGPKDLDLAQRMIRAGTSDRKFMRQIMVSVDITAPLYWWKEMDTYKVGTVANSTSTMHKLATTPITIDCFETDDMTDVIIEDSSEPTFIVSSGYAFNTYINWLEELRQRYNEVKDQKFWKELIRLLPESWLQTRTVTLNYEVLRNIYSQRKHHRLTEWHSFCTWIKELPYAGELILYNLD